jgi:Arylsulfatase A and related enzymes
MFNKLTKSTEESLQTGLFWFKIHSICKHKTKDTLFLIRAIFCQRPCCSEGGTRNPLIVYYPKGIKDKGGIRTQYGHVIDLLPTTTEYLGIKQPEYIWGIKQDSIQGSSLAYTFDNATAPSRHKIQHYYIFGSRSIYADGWKAGALHPNAKYNKSIPAHNPDPNRLDKDTWELYNLNTDFNETTDLAKKYPEKLKELKALFDQQAEKYNLYPLLDWQDVYDRHPQIPEKLQNLNK